MKYPSNPSFKYSEHHLQIAVAHHLDERKDLAWCHPPNEGKRSQRYGAKLKAAGMKKGEPDCIIYMQGGRTLFIELKRKGERLKPAQEDRHALLRTFGFSVYVVYAVTPQEAVDKVEDILNQQGDNNV